MATRKKQEDKMPDFDKSAGTEAPGKVTGEDVRDIALLKNEQARKVFGFLLLVFTAILFISFVSFFFSWKSDQDFLASANWAEYKQFYGHVSNAMGIMGARIGYLFVQNGFGLAAFAILPYLALSGLYLLFNYKPYSLLRIAVHTVLFTVWFSLFLGFVFQIWAPLLGGAFGYFGIEKLSHSLGMIGAFLVLATYAFVYSLLFLNLNPLAKINLKSPQPAPEVVVEESKPVEFSEPVLPEAEIFIDEEPVEEEIPEVDIRDLPPIVLKKKEPEPEIEWAPVINDEPEIQPIQEPEVPGLIELDTEITEPTPVLPAVQSLNDDFVIEDKTAEEEEMLEENLGGEMPERRGLDTIFDPTAELSKYKFPTLDLLNEYDVQKQEIDMAEIESSKNLIIETLKNYNIGISKIKASVGPTVTLFEIVPAPGVKISKIRNLDDDIALSLSALGIRIIAPIPGKGTIGIEVPNKKPEMVPMRAVLASKKFQECDFQLPVALGKTISNEIFVADLAKMPHLLMAGATGQGKSVGLNAILVSLLYKKHPAYIKFVLVDPKKVELTLYNKIERHFLAKLPGDGEAIITENSKVINTLNSLCVEMDNRYKLLQDAMVRTIVEYNEKFKARKLNPNNGHRFMPYIIVVIDEVADLMMTAGKEIEMPIARLAQLARAIGIHLILATQRPSVNVITGMIKANFPARIAFRVTSKIDSRTILDSNGADQLIGKGDMLFSGGNDMIRLQCPFVDTPEVDKIVDYIGEQRAYPTAYLLPEVQDENGSGGKNDGFDPNERDELFEDAARLVVLNQVGSTSLIQRKMKIGYNRAGRLMDQLEDAGIVGPNQGSKARNVLFPDEYSLEQFLNNLDK